MPRERVPTGESLVVLTRDAALVQTLKVLGSEHTVVSVASESDLANELLHKQMGVAIIDAGAATSPVERLTERLKSQFPDLVLIVAGRLDDQNALTAQITTGIVYRFLHKPASEQRVKLFVDAAWRRHGQELSGETEPLTTTGVPPDGPAPFARNAIWSGAVVFALLLIVGGWFVTRKAPHPPAPRAVDTATPAPRDEQLEDLLARGDKALAAGALLTPPGKNAADLYKQALSRNSTDPRAAAGLENVIGKLLSAAEAELAAQHLDEAQKLADQARAIKSDHVRVAFLTTRIGKERERLVLSQARQAAANGELEQKQLDEHINDFLAKAADRMQGGQLVEPAQDNARFFIESARTLAPNRPDVQAAEKQLQDTLVAQVRTALSAGNVQSAQQWIDVATESGVSQEEITDLTREAQRVQTSAKADAMARLASLFDQRLTQGHIVDPPSDCAKFYLTQLLQSDATNPATVLARQSLANRTLEEAGAAVARQDYTGAGRWLAEANEAGADGAGISAIEHNIAEAQETARRQSEIVNAGSLELAHYSAPTFPISARERGVSGWVDLEFLVKADGVVADVLIKGAEPVGIFEEAAVDAIKKWRYKPMQRDGQVIEQRARLRMKFALDK